MDTGWKRGRIGYVDLAGSRFNRWTVLERVVGGPRCVQPIWLCQCSCGKLGAIRSGDLKNGASKSCGCLKAEVTRSRATTHGESGKASRTRTYRIWTGMLARCRTPTVKDYKYYGARGISVCEKWLRYEEFLADMGHAPAKLSIERMNNDGNYEPSNCKWATQSEQARNRRKLPRRPTLKDAIQQGMQP